MSLKQLNAKTKAKPTPQGWTPDKRFIDYPYAKQRDNVPPLPQDPQSTARKRAPLDADTLDAFRVRRE